MFQKNPQGGSCEGASGTNEEPGVFEDAGTTAWVGESQVDLKNTWFHGFSEDDLLGMHHDAPCPLNCGATSGRKGYKSYSPFNISTNQLHHRPNLRKRVGVSKVCLVSRTRNPKGYWLQQIMKLITCRMVGYGFHCCSIPQLRSCWEVSLAKPEFRLEIIQRNYSCRSMTFPFGSIEWGFLHENTPVNLGSCRLTLARMPWWNKETPEAA